MYVFSLESQDKLETCCPDLIRLFNEIIKHRDCKVIYGRRGKEEQDRLFKDGKSKLNYPKSYHNRYPSRAVDVVPYFSKRPHVRWDDIESFKAFGNFVLGVAAVLDIPVEWGGNWKKFVDMAHWQIRE